MFFHHSINSATHFLRLTETAGDYLWKNCPPATYNPVTSVALGCIGISGITYLWNYLSPHMHASSTISESVPAVYLKTYLLIKYNFW